MMGAERFDFASYRAAVEGKHVGSWLGFFAEQAEWREYRATNPPRSPNVVAGRPAIGPFLEGVAASPVRHELSHEVEAVGRVAYRLWATLEDGRHIIEHVLLELDGARIVSQVDVEAWD
jgi:hypothetical protein